MVAAPCTRVRLDNLTLPFVPGDAVAAAALRRAAAAQLGLAGGDLVAAPQLLRRALDLRRGRLRLQCSVALSLPQALARRLLRRGAVRPHAPQPHALPRLRRPPPQPPVVVGAGPAGLFAALVLCEGGAPPLLLERGRAVEQRGRDVARLYAHGILQPDSNVCFGEGGAGTFSDGKLYTRVGDPRVEAVLARLVGFGAPAEILTDNRPHLGTDRLVRLLKNLRAHLLAMGAQIHFDTTVTDWEIDAGALRAVRLRGGERLETRQAVVCTGHSAVDVWEALARAGLPLQARPFAMGLRIEHPQQLVDAARYGRHAGQAGLPAADYRLTHRDAARDVWSFCMCPGGVVVTTPTRAGELCINGMSHAARAGRYANSAVVASVGPADFAAAGGSGAFAGHHLQRLCEARAYAAGGGAFVAPACRVDDFIAGRAPRDLGPSSYRRGLRPAPLETLYPAPLIEALRRALRRFGKTLPGFDSREGTLIGIESRTASPVRLPRDTSLQAEGARGLYPAGEGMGYGGGIVSAAVDGMRAAESMLQALGAEAAA